MRLGRGVWRGSLMPRKSSRPQRAKSENAPITNRTCGFPAVKQMDTRWPDVQRQGRIRARLRKMCLSAVWAYPSGPSVSAQKTKGAIPMSCRISAKAGGQDKRCYAGPLGSVCAGMMDKLRKSIELFLDGHSGRFSFPGGHERGGLRACECFSQRERICSVQGLTNHW